jgi:hypothetical protein
MKRRRIALGLTILWIAGFELMPWLHIALHAHLPHHHHAANGADILDDHDAEVDQHAADDHDAEVDEQAADDHDAEVDEHAADDHDAEVDEHAADDHDAEVDEHAADHDDDLDAEVDEHGVPVHVAHAHHHTRHAEVALLRALAHGQHSFAHHGIAVPVPAPAITTPLPVDRRPITLAIVERPAWISAAVPEASARGPPAFLG